MRDYFQDVLPLGHCVVAIAQNGRELVEKCRTAQPDLVITDIKMPELDGIDAGNQIYQERPVPVILVSAYHDAALIERAEMDHVMGYLVKPIKRSDLGRPSRSLYPVLPSSRRYAKKPTRCRAKHYVSRKIIKRAERNSHEESEDWTRPALFADSRSWHPRKIANWSRSRR